MPRLDPTTKLSRERAGRSLRWVADELRLVAQRDVLYLPAGVSRELQKLGGQAYRYSRLLDPSLLAADRAKLAAIFHRAEVAGQLPEFAGLTVDELAALLHA